MAVVVVVEVVKIEQLETVHMRNLRSRFSGKVQNWVQMAQLLPALVPVTLVISPVLARVASP